MNVNGSCTIQPVYWPQELVEPVLLYLQTSIIHMYDHSITFYYSYTQACHVVVGLDLLMQWRFLS